MVASGTPCESSSTVSRSGHLVASMRRRRSMSSDSSKPTSNARMVGVACVADICSPSGREEVDEQPVDALGLVVVDPVRGVGQALDAVEVGDVLVVGLGEIRAEVAILLAPDDQGGRRDWLKLRLGALRRAYRGAVVVDHRGRCALLRPRLDVAIGLLLRVPRLGVAEEVLEELPVLRAHVVLGQVWEREVEEVPGPRELA